MTITKIFFTIMVGVIVLLGYFENAHSDSFVSESNIRDLKGFKFGLQRIDSKELPAETGIVRMPDRAKGDAFVSESNIRDLKGFKSGLQRIDSKELPAETGIVKMPGRAKGDAFVSESNIKTLEEVQLDSK